jgi:pimeloyl-ACP methyl ester carboxylesterase
MNAQRALMSKLTMPVLAIGGQVSSMTGPEVVMKAVANDVQGLVIPGAGHFLAEEAPEQMIAALTEFLAPYREETPTR